MRLIIKYNVGDGYTWNAEVILPVEYESKEHLELEILDQLEKWHIKQLEYEEWAKGDRGFRNSMPRECKTNQEKKKERKWMEHYKTKPEVPGLLNLFTETRGIELNIDDFVWQHEGKWNFSPPTVYTIDEWFAKEGLK